jgi:hypothetical protein
LVPLDLFDAYGMDPLFVAELIKPVEDEADFLPDDDRRLAVNQDVCVK